MLSQHFRDGNFAQLSSARLVRVAIHPSVQGIRDGDRVIELLYRYVAHVLMG